MTTHFRTDQSFLNEKREHVRSNQIWVIWAEVLSCTCNLHWISYVLLQEALLITNDSNTRNRRVRPKRSRPKAYFEQRYRLENLAMRYLSLLSILPSNSAYKQQPQRWPAYRPQLGDQGISNIKLLERGHFWTNGTKRPQILPKAAVNRVMPCHVKYSRTRRIPHGRVGPKAQVELRGKLLIRHTRGDTNITRVYFFHDWSILVPYSLARTLDRP